jgi:hypothetical protein
MGNPRISEYRLPSMISSSSPSTLKLLPAILGGVAWLCGAGISRGDVLDDLDQALNRISVGDPDTEAYFRR